MAVAGQISLDLQTIEDGDGTLETALRLWCSRNKPIMYNQWQSLFSQVRKAVLGKETPYESQSERAEKTKILYDEIMLEQHGSDYKALAVKAQCANIVSVSGPSKRAKLSGGSSAVAAEVSSTSDIQAVADDITGGGIAQDGGTEQKSIEAGTGTLVQTPGARDGSLRHSSIIRTEIGRKRRIRRRILNRSNDAANPTRRFTKKDRCSQSGCASGGGRCRDGAGMFT